MKRLALAAAITACLLVGVVAATAGARPAVATKALDAPIRYGVADDGGKYSDTPATWFGLLKAGGLTQDRWTVSMDQTKPTTINELPFILKAAPAAQAAGVRIIISLLAPTVKDAGGNVVLPSNLASAQQDAFCNWAVLVVNAVKPFGIHDFIIGNEVNTATFWAPQDTTAAPDYESTLAKCYSAIHGADSQANVIGFALSPRSNGNASQQEPLTFLSEAAAAYKASNPTGPIMDQLSIHPYPNPNSPGDSPDVGYGDPLSYGIPNLDRVKQTIYNGFNGTPQPTTLNGLTFLVDELGWQTQETSGSHGYTGSENVPGITDEATQANDIQQSVQKYFACDPTVTDVDYFLLVDEANLGAANGSSGYQSGFLRPDLSPKPAYTQDAPFFNQGRAACTGAQVNWKPAGTTTGGGGGSQPSGKPKPKQKCTTVRRKVHGKWKSVRVCKTTH